MLENNITEVRVNISHLMHFQFISLCHQCESPTIIMLSISNIITTMIILNIFSVVKMEIENIIKKKKKTQDVRTRLFHYEAHP